MKAGWRHRQQGATFLGILIIGGILMMGVYAGIRLVPLYSEYSSIVKALNQVARDGGDESPNAIRGALQRQWDIDDIKSLDVKQIQIRKTGSGTEIRAEYRAEAPFVGNVSLVVDFDKTVVMGGAKF